MLGLLRVWEMYTVEGMTEDHDLVVGALPSDWVPACLPGMALLSFCQTKERKTVLQEAKQGTKWPCGWNQQEDTSASLGKLSGGQNTAVSTHDPQLGLKL